MRLSAQFIYNGMPDYWGGDGDRWDDNKGCLFAYYGRNTTIRDMIDEWTNDFMNGGDCDTFPEDVTAEDVRAALLAMLTDEGRKDYESGVVSEFATFFDECNPLACSECGEKIGCEHQEGCNYRDENDPYVVDDDYEDEYDSPFAVVLIEVN